MGETESIRIAIRNALSNSTLMQTTGAKIAVEIQHHHHYHHTTGLTWCKHSRASGPRYKVSVAHVASVRKSRKTDIYVFNDLRNDAKVGADVT